MVNVNFVQFTKFCLILRIVKGPNVVREKEMISPVSVNLVTHTRDSKNSTSVDLISVIQERYFYHLENVKNAQNIKLFRRMADNVLIQFVRQDSIVYLTDLVNFVQNIKSQVKIKSHASLQTVILVNISRKTEVAICVMNSKIL